MNDNFLKLFEDRIAFHQKEMELSWEEREGLTTDTDGLFSRNIDKQNVGYVPKTIRNEGRHSWRVHNVEQLATLVEGAVPAGERAWVYPEIFKAMDHFFRLEDEPSLKTKELQVVIKELRKITGYRNKDGEFVHGVFDKLKIFSTFGSYIENDLKRSKSKFLREAIVELVRAERSLVSHKKFSAGRRPGDIECVLILGDAFFRLADNVPGFEAEIEEFFFLNRTSYSVASAENDSEKSRLIRTLIFHIVNTFGSDMAAKGVRDILELGDRYVIPENIQVGRDTTLDDALGYAEEVLSIKEQIAQHLYETEGRVVDPARIELTSSGEKDSSLGMVADGFEINQEF